MSGCVVNETRRCCGANTATTKTKKKKKCTHCARNTRIALESSRDVQSVAAHAVDAEIKLNERSEEADGSRGGVMVETVV